MSRAEERALEAYPDIQQPIWDESYPKVLFTRNVERGAFIQGYHQAEKDLALTWEDIEHIVQIHDDVIEVAGGTPKDFAEETLRRFNEQRIKNDNA